MPGLGETVSNLMKMRAAPQAAGPRGTTTW